MFEQKVIIMTDLIMLNTLKKLISSYLIDDNEKLECDNCNSFKELLNIVIKYGYDELVKVIKACYKYC